MRKVYVAGAGMTHFGKFHQRTLRSLAEEATSAALADAGVRPEDIEMVFFGNAVNGIIDGQEMIRGQVALRNTGLLGIPIINVENACASASSAFYLAWLAVAAGAADTALAIGAEKLTHPDKRRSFAAIETAVDLSQLEDLRRQLTSGNGHETNSLNRSFFMDIYADMTIKFMERTGTTERDLARVSVKSHKHASFNPKAQYRDPVTEEEVLNSRRIAGPLTLLMCSPIGDGAAALVLCSERKARQLSLSPVEVLACVPMSGKGSGGEAPSTPGEPLIQRAARTAYEQAGAGPADIDVIELHDATAPAELMLYGELELCAPEDAASLLSSGHTSLGGRQPVNPSGGLLSRGHPIGATGCAQLVELVDQLKGRAGQRQVEGCRLALAQNAGGFLGEDPAAAVITILGR